MAASPRTRFEVLKRDLFTCRYCGQSSPAVVLEVDHVIPVSAGGSDDPMNLVTSCWDCNRGKSAVPLSEVMTGEDPHDRAILLLERERQLREYNEVLAVVRERVQADADALSDYWRTLTGKKIYGRDRTWLENALSRHPLTVIYGAMDRAERENKTTGLAYVNYTLTALAAVHG